MKSLIELRALTEQLVAAIRERQNDLAKSDPDFSDTEECELLNDAREYADLVLTSLENI